MVLILWYCKHVTYWLLFSFLFTEWMSLWSERTSSSKRRLPYKWWGNEGHGQKPGFGARPRGLSCLLPAARLQLDSKKLKLESLLWPILQKPYNQIYSYSYLPGPWGMLIYQWLGLSTLYKFYTWQLSLNLKNSEGYISKYKDISQAFLCIFTDFDTHTQMDFHTFWNMYVHGSQ